MTPRAGIIDWNITTSPDSPQSTFKDRYDNTSSLVYLPGEHDLLEITATGVVETSSPTGAPLEEYRQESALSDFSDSIRDLSETGSIDEILARLRTLIEYESGITNVTTTASGALSQGKGVCQDYAHVALAALRMSGYCARYVAGYLFGEGATHAWVDVWDEDQKLWQVYDPTHEITNVSSLIPVAVGRDYSDTAPVNGIYLGAESADVETIVKMELSEV